jgi:serine/threonine protein kinase
MALVGRDVAQGLWYLHRQGILHLDLKPANIMLESRLQGQWDAPRAVIAGFGMAAIMQPGQGYILEESFRYDGN